MSGTFHRPGRAVLSSNLARALLALAAASLLVQGCGGGSVVEGKKIDYKSAQTLPPLEVPPDLKAPPTDDRFQVPESGAKTYSEYSQGKPKAAGTTGLLPKVENAHVERAGTQRWLVVKAAPEQLWPQVKDFWQDLGFIVVVERPEAGVMETDWAENRANIPQSGIRKLLGKVMDSAYSTPERDKYRTRLERGADDTTEIYITHRGVYEAYMEQDRTSARSTWQARPTDPNLEAEMLARMMARLASVPEPVARTEVNAKPPAPRARLSKSESGASTLLLQDGFDRAWRRVGLALDRVGFTVQDRDRAKGVYYVRYVDPVADATGSSFIDKLAFWKGDAPKPGDEFRIQVAAAQPEGSQVSVLPADGKTAHAETSGRILNLLLEELK